MLFKELKNIRFVWSEPEKSIKKLKSKYNINAPDLVIKQFYFDHHDKEEFNDLYGDLNLHQIKWTTLSVETEELINIGDSATFPDFVKEVSEDASYYEIRGDSAIHVRKEVSKYWKNYGTWMTPPVFINGEILKKPSNKLHLVEGHMRLGCLTGISKYKIIKLSKKHKIFYGNY